MLLWLIFAMLQLMKRKNIGIKINELKKTVTDKINSLREQLDENQTEGADIDLTRTAYPIRLGTRHPLTIVTNKIIDIFQRMGFVMADGPEIDDDKHVFTMLNFAADHPARDMQDTFFIEQSDPNDVTKNIFIAFSYFWRSVSLYGDSQASFPYSLSRTCI